MKSLQQVRQELVQKYPGVSISVGAVAWRHQYNDGSHSDVTHFYGSIHGGGMIQASCNDMNTLEDVATSLDMQMRKAVEEPVEVAPEPQVVTETKAPGDEAVLTIAEACAAPFCATPREDFVE